MTGVKLTGLDGSIPLAFLAALGALRVVDDRARRAGHALPRLVWIDEGTWVPMLLGIEGMDDLIGAIVEDRSTWADEPAFSFAYSKDGERVAPGSPGAVRDLKPKPPLMRAFLDELALAASNGAPRSARHAAAYGTDVATDNNGNTKPTALHFTAGNQTFLGAVAEVHERATEDDFREALVGPWSRSSPLKSLGWDPMGAFSARMYALRASDPSKENRPCVPGAEWLAFVGLSFFPTVPRKRQVFTTCVDGGWKDAKLTWPLWTIAATARSIESLLRTEHLADMPAKERAARGIGAVFSAAILRSDQGGYGSFSPAGMR